MPVYTASNGAIIADITALRAIPSTDLLTSGFVVLFVASENSWFEYNPALTSGDVVPINNPTNGRWIRIGRDKLTANRTYFVRTDGNDANTGLVNTSGGAFASLGKFYQVLATLDKNGFEVTCQLASGTYTVISTINVTDGVGVGTVTITGSTATASDCLIQATNIDLLVLSSIKNTIFQNLELSVLSSDYKNCIRAKDSIFTVKNVAFNLTSNGVGLDLSVNSGINGESLNFKGSGYVSIIASLSSFDYKDSTSIIFNATLALASFQGQGGRFAFFDVTFSGTGTKSHFLRGYSVVVYKSGKSLTGTTTDSIVTIV